MTDEKLREAYVKYQMLEQQLKQIQQQIKVIEQQIVEIETTKQALEEIGKVKVGEEMLVPVANGIFIKAEIKDNQNAILNVGSEVAVEKPLSKAKKLMHDQQEQVQLVHQQLLGTMAKLGAQMQVLEQELQKLVK